MRIKRSWVYMGLLQVCLVFLVVTLVALPSLAGLEELDISFSQPKVLNRIALVGFLLFLGLFASEQRK